MAVVRRRVTAATAVAAATNGSLLNNNLTVLAVDEQCQEGGPGKEDYFHDSQRKASLQHCAGLVDVQRQRVVHLRAVLAEGTEGDPDGTAIPVCAVGVCDEAQLVDSCDESAEEAHIKEGDEE